MPPFAARLEDLRRRIDAACRRAGRDPGEVKLVAVTKSLPDESLDSLAGLGITDIGENRVLEALTRRNKTRAAFVWHMIGHLQTNKVKKALEWTDVLHSVDRPALVEELEKQSARGGRRLSCYVQVNASGELTKGGYRTEDAEEAVVEIRKIAPHLELLGLMTLAPEGGDARGCFRRLRELAGRCELRGLSMGMSQDFEVAIEEGATCVRVGSALFSVQGGGSASV